MYATVRRFEGVTDPREVARRVNEGLVPLISQIPGCLASSWVDAGGGVMVSINLFENQVGEEEANRQAPDWVRQQIADAHQSAATDKGAQLAGLLLSVGGQLSEHFLFPFCLDDNLQLPKSGR